MTRTADDMLNMGPQELLIILIIALVVVGPKRLPELGRSIGQWVRELRKAQDEVKRTIRVGLDEPNGDGAARARTRPAAETGSSASPPAAPGSSVQDPTPTVGDTPTADEVREISRSLGRSLGQLRKAREEVQRSFRVDLGRPTPTKPSTTTSPPPRAGSGDASTMDTPGAEPVRDDPAPG